MNDNTLQIVSAMTDIMQTMIVAQAQAAKINAILLRAAAERRDVTPEEVAEISGGFRAALAAARDHVAGGGSA